MMYQRIVAVRQHVPAELAAGPAEISLAVRRCVESRGGVDVSIRARLQKLREWIAVAGQFPRMLLNIPADVEQRRRTERLAAPMRQEVRQRPLTRRYDIGLAVPQWVEIRHRPA